MNPAPERRRLTRIAIAIQARLTESEGSEVSARLQNLSLIGLSAEVSRPLAPGTRCRVELAADGLTVEAHALVVRASARNAALRFEQLPYESYERLRALLLSHASDPAVIAAELADRLGHLGESA